MKQNTLGHLKKASDPTAPSVIEFLANVLNDRFSLLGITDPPKIRGFLG